MKKTDDPVVIQQTVDASKESVWRALTDATRMRQWYFGNIPSFEPVVGFEVQFDVESNERTFTHVWTVTDVEPITSIAYQWQYEGHPGDSTVRFDLSDRDGGTHVRLTHTPTETFPQEIPEFQRDACLQGWKYVIETALKDFVESDSASHE